MTADQWLRVKELFDGAVERDRGDRAAFLEAECAGDAAVRGEVERLLKAHDEASGFIEQSPVAGPSAPKRSLTGVVIGPVAVGVGLNFS